MDWKKINNRELKLVDMVVMCMGCCVVSPHPCAP